MLIRSTMIALLLGTATYSAANAQSYTITRPVSFGPISDPGPITFTVPNFNTSAGTLTGYSFTLTGTLSASVFYPTVTSALAGTFTNSVIVETGSGGPTIALPGAIGVASGDILRETVDISFTSTLPLAYIASEMPSGLDITLFLGAVATLTDPTSGGGATSERLALSSATITETFDVQESLPMVDPATSQASVDVPEPMSLAMLGIGLIGIVAARSRLQPTTAKLG